MELAVYPWGVLHVCLGGDEACSLIGVIHGGNDCVLSHHQAVKTQSVCLLH